MTISQAAQRREDIVSAAVRQRLLDADDAPLAGFVDLDGVADSVRALRTAFPSSVSVRHAFAAKANPLVPLLQHLRGLGMGCEVAGAGELAQALSAGFTPEQIVFDSPLKTRAELCQALELGVAVNADNFQELARIGTILATRSSTSRIGIRVNPQVGAGSIAQSSTATATSKFGIALEDNGNVDRLLHAYREHPWLTWLHAHVGSQGCPLDLIAQGIAKTVAFAEKVNAELGRRQIVGIDIGGGLPVDFDSDDSAPGFDAYVARLRDHAPELFTGDYRLITEFGHSLLSKNGFTAAYVEYTKTAGELPIAITHAGAHVAARTVFQPDSWPLRVTAHHPTGATKTGPLTAQDIAGPLCFAGDVIARARPLPELAPGDIVAVLDTGAYCFSAPYHFNGLLEPAVYGARTAGDGSIAFQLLRSAETMDHLLSRSGTDVMSQCRVEGPLLRGHVPPHPIPVQTGAVSPHRR